MTLNAVAVKSTQEQVDDSNIDDHRSFFVVTGVERHMIPFGEREDMAGECVGLVVRPVSEEAKRLRDQIVRSR